jgi:hypothetical protein
MKPRQFQIGSNRFSSLEPTPVYDSYWKFAAERQKIYFRRISGARGPWTDDDILGRYRFTNVYRASDRVSQYLIRNVIYGPNRADTPDEILFRVLLFKLFNKIETWELLERALGPLSLKGFDEARYDTELTRALNHGTRIYSAAYIIPPVKIGSTDGVKHRGHLSLLAYMFNDGLARKVASTRSLKDLFLTLTHYPSIGNFLGFQLAIDIAYSEVISHEEEQFVVAGPGAIDGISKCFSNAGDFEAAEIVGYMVDRQEFEFERLGLDFKDLFGRRLQPIDCQNLFCEISKYARVAHPEFVGSTGRTRIKQLFKPAGRAPAPFFPPKWGINPSIPAWAKET